MAVLLFFLHLAWAEPEIFKTQTVPVPLKMWRGDVARERVVKFKDGAFAYDIVINRDRHGFRLIEGTSAKKALTQHLFFVGCSQTFGEGLKDDETFSSLISQQLPQTRVVNMGLSGSGPTEHLHLWRTQEMTDFFPEQEGVMVYSLIFGHFERLRRIWRYLSWAPGPRPYYRRVGDGLEYVGPIEETASFWWAKKVKDTAFEKMWLQATSHFIPWQLSGVADELAFYLAHLKKEYLKRYPRGRFFVTWQANTSPGLSPEVNMGEILEAFKKHDIEVWRNAIDKKHFTSRAAFDDYITARRIPVDGHPNALANREYADFLMAQLQSIGFTERPALR